MDMEVQSGLTHKGRQNCTLWSGLVLPRTGGTFMREWLAAPPVTPQCCQVCSLCMWLSRSFLNNFPLLCSKAKGGWNLTSVANKSYLVRFDPYPKLLISFRI